MKSKISKSALSILTASAFALSLAGPAGATSDATETTEVTETTEMTTTTLAPSTTASDALEPVEITGVDLGVGQCLLKVTNNHSRHDEVTVYVTIDGEKVEESVVHEAEKTANEVSEKSFDIPKGATVKIYKTFKDNSSLDATGVSCIAAPATPVVEKPTFTG